MLKFSSYNVYPQTVYKDGRHDSSPKVKPKHLHCPLVAGCSIGYKSSKYKSNKFFLKMDSVILRGSYYADVCSSVNFSDEFGFN